MSPVAAALRRIDFTDRRLQAGAALAGLAALALWLAAGIANDEYDRVPLVLGLVAAPFAIVLALRRPMLFPYGLYVLLIPFDNVLALGAIGGLTKLLGVASAAAIMVHVVRTRRIVKPSATLWAWGAFWLFAVIGLTWSPDVPEGMKYVVSLAQIIVLYGVLASAPLDERDLRMLLTCVVIGGALAAIYGLVLFRGALGAQDDASWRLAVSVDNRGIDSNHFANALLAPFAISLVTLLNARRPAVALGGLGAVALFGTAIVMTLSREAMLGCVLIVFTIIAFSKRRVLVAAVVVPLLALIPLLVPAVSSRIAETLSEQGGGRTYIWRALFLAWQQHPWFGWGTGGAGTAYNANYLQVYARVIEHRGAVPHNVYLHAAVELGVVGLILICFALFRAFADVRRVPRTHPLHDVRVMLTASLIALCFVATFIDNTDYKYLWVVIALAAQYRLVVRRAEAPS